MDMYRKSILDTTYMYEKNKMFNIKNDVTVVSKKFISSGTVIKTFCAQTSPIKPEDIIVCIA